jgi:sphingomyelin phosphodiesterase acid-like 3
MRRLMHALRIVANGSRKAGLTVAAAAALLGVCAPRDVPAAPQQHWLLVSDVHFDPFADPALVPKLAAAPATEWQRIFAPDRGAAPSAYGADTNYALLASSLHEMKASTPAPAVVVIAGDFLAHDFRKQYQSSTHDASEAGYERFVDRTIAFLALEFRATYPDAQFVPAAGNNDSYCGDYEAAPGSPFFAHMAAAWAPLVTRGGRAPGFVREFGADGHYVASTGIGIGIVVPNSVYWSARYQDACGTATNPPAAEETWFSGALASIPARRRWVVTHIPAGIDAYASQYGAPVTMYGPANVAAVPASIDRAAVRTVLVGHVHMNDLRVTRAGSPLLLIPSISPVFANNPAYLDATVGPDGIADFTAYVLPLGGAQAAARWSREYRFSAAYGVKGISGAAVRALHARIATDPAIRNRWARYYGSSSPKAGISPSSWRGYWCAQTALRPDAYAACAARPSPPPSALPQPSPGPT